MKLEQELDLRPDSAVSVDADRKTSNPWLLHTLLVFALLVWLFTWYGDTTLSTIAIWQRSETYAHGYLIFPISAYLIWTRRHQIFGMQPKPSLVGIFSLVGLGLLWLIANSAEALVVSQYALVAMVPAIVWAVLGHRIGLEMLFPLLFLLFAVPVGDFLLAPMMNFTADFTVAALRLTGIPVFREGNFFTVPSGSWSVVEACSGLRYLIASLTLGCLFSYLTYRSMWRRLVFIALSIIVPIIANGIRAYLIVMIGHLSNNRLATGVDHVIYGWVFFGFVMMLLFWIGSQWREAEEPLAPMLQSPQTPQASHPRAPANMAIFALLSAVTIAIWPSYARHIDPGVINAKPVKLEIPSNVENWRARSDAITDWQPHYLTASATAKQAFERDGKKVEVLVKYYRNQRQDAELINSDNQLVSTRDAVWGLTSSGSNEVEASKEPLQISESTLRSMRGNLVVWTWYWVDGSFTSNIYLAKIYQAKAKLFGESDDAAAIFVYAPYDGKPEDAKQILREFVSAAFGSIRSSLSNAKL